MEYFAVEGGWPLEGQVPVHGAKNSALPILAATLLADGESIIHNCPSLTDCAAALEILSCLGVPGAAGGGDGGGEHRLPPGPYHSR